MTKASEPTGLALLRAPFPPNQISKLPKASKAQNDALKQDFKKGIRCQVCGGWHLPEVVHLDYVGHAALTDRLLDVDPHWFWEPIAFNAEGLPAFDRNGGLWIRLTILDQSRIGYGGADGKQGTDAVKEIIGDALRNAAMRFGAALDLWHKGDLHLDSEHSNETVPEAFNFPAGPAKGITEMKKMARALWREIEGCGDTSELNALLDTSDCKALLKQMSELENPAHREIWEGDGKDNPGIAGLITRKETEFAQYIADVARA